MSTKSKQSFLRGAAVLAASTVIIKLLGAIYKIPLGNILGDSGYALFYSAYSIYNVLLSLSTAGLPVAVSKMVSEANTLGHYHQVKKIYRVAFITFAVTGATGFLIMFAFAQPLAGLMKNPDAVYCIMALAPSVALVCLMSIYRGYIQGLSNMTPTAISQVLEVLFKVILGLGLSIWLKSQGYSMMIVAAGAIFGVSAGSLVSLLYLIAANRKQGKYLCEPSEAEPPADSGKLIFKRLVGIGIPILLGSLALSFTMLIDDFQIMNRLQTVAGFSYDQAKVLFGAYSKVFTVMNLPPAFVVPLTLSIIPAVTSRITMKDQEGAARICVSALRITSSLALPAGVGLCVLAQPIIHTLYSDIHSSGGSILALLGFASFFLCLAYLTTAILQAYGKIYIPIYTMLAGGLVKITVNLILVANPRINIIGAPIGVIACYAVICVLNLIAIVRLMPKMPSFGKIFGRPLVASAFMGAAAYFTYRLLSSILEGRLSSSVRLTEAAAMLIAIGVGMIVYLILVVALGIIGKEDVGLMPKGEKLVRLFRLR